MNIKTRIMKKKKIIERLLVSIKIDDENWILYESYSGSLTLNVEDLA